MTFDPKIFIRDYSTPTVRALAYAGVYDLDGNPVDLERALILRAENIGSGEGNVLLSGDATDGDDILVFSGDEGPSDYVLTNSALVRMAGNDVALYINLNELAVLAGEFDLTGQDVEFLRGVLLAGDTSAFLFSSLSVTLRRALVVAAAQRGYTISGAAVNLNLGYVRIVDTTSFALTGYDISFSHDWVMPAALKTYTFTLRDANLTRTLISHKTAASYALTGAAANLFTLTTAEEGILFSGDMQSGTDTVLLSGDDGPGHLITSLLSDALAETGSFVLTGNAVKFQRSMVATTSTFALAGQIGLLHTTRKAETGTFALTGYDAVLALPLPVTTAAFNVSTNSATLTYTSIDKILTTGDEQGGVDAIELSGDETGVLLQDYNVMSVALDTGTFAISGSVTFSLNVSVALSGDMQSGTDDLELSGDEAGNKLRTTKA